MRVCGRHIHQVDLAISRTKPAHKIAHLHGEPQHAVGVKHQGVWVLRLFIRHLVFFDLAGFCVELADVPFEISSEPDVVFGIRYQPVRAGIVDLQGKFFERSRGRVDAPNLVLHLFGEPECAVHPHGWIMRMGAFGGHVPLFNGDFQFAYIGSRRRSPRTDGGSQRNRSNQRTVDHPSHLRSRSHKPPPQFLLDARGQLNAVEIRGKEAIRMNGDRAAGTRNRRNLVPLRRAFFPRDCAAPAFSCPVWSSRRGRCPGRYSRSSSRRWPKRQKGGTNRTCRRILPV